MPIGALVVAFRWLLTSVLGNLIVKLIAGLGIGVVAYTGMSVLVGQITGYINSQVGGTSAEVANVLNYCGFFTGLNIIVGAITARIGTGTAYRFILSRAPTT